MINKNCGIYKITSPTGRVYIGQAINIKRRWRSYELLTPSIKNQKLLYRSFIKYGIVNHQFDIIEYCSEEDLNCSERFWQDYFDVLNGGLNCKLTECGEKRIKDSIETRLLKSFLKKGCKNHASKKVIDTSNGILYDSATEVSIKFNISKTTLCQYLRGARKNKTKFMYHENFILL